MKTQMSGTAIHRVSLILLPSLLFLQGGVCLAELQGLSSDFYQEEQSIENLVIDTKDMAGKSRLDPYSQWIHKIELSEDTAVWNQRMRRNWNTGDTALSGQDCSKGSPCSSIAIGKGAKATTGTVTVDGPKITGTVGTKSRVTQSSNMAIGKEATANMGNVTVHGSKIKGMVTNQSHVKQSTNKAIGKGATANMGSVTVQGSRIKGMVTNQSRVKQSINQARSEGATANMGSVTVEDSKIKGTVTNQSRVTQSANRAIGKGATANMGSVGID